MTIKEFFESPELIAIHCYTEERAKDLCNAFGRAGYKWDSGLKYTEYTSWSRYKEETCYSNKRSFADVEFYQNHGYRIIEFEEIDIESDKLDTFKAFHWLGHLLDGGNLDEYRLKYLRTFTQVICDILSDHEIYTTNDLREAMKELECIQALDEVRNDLHDLEYDLNDIQLKIERSRSKWKK